MSVWQAGLGGLPFLVSAETVSGFVKRPGSLGCLWLDDWEEWVVFKTPGQTSSPQRVRRALTGYPRQVIAAR